MANRKSFDLERAAKLYSDGFSINEIGKIFDVHRQTVVNRFKEADIKLRPSGPKPMNIDLDLIKNDYVNNDMSVKQIAEKHSIGITTVHKKLNSCGIRCPRIGRKRFAINIDRNRLRDLYLIQEKTIQECSEYLNVDKSIIRRHLKEMKIKTRPGGYANLIKDINNEEIVDLYCNHGLSMSQIAEKIGRSRGLVKSRLTKIKADIRSRAEGTELWREKNGVSNEEIIYLHDKLKWSCAKISEHFKKSRSFVSKRFETLGKRARRAIGQYSGTWKGGITEVGDSVRRCDKYLKWRESCFQTTNCHSEISGKKTRDLNCHHIYPFHIILQSSLTQHKPLPKEYHDLAIVGDRRFYDSDNGLVVTKEEHGKIELGKLNQAHPWWKIWQAYPDFAINRSNLSYDDFQLCDAKGQLQPIEYTIQKSTAKEIRQIIRYEHYLGTIPRSQLILVAKRGNIIIGIATFGTGTNRFIKDGVWELTRLCIPFYVVRPFGCDFLAQCRTYIKDNCPQIKSLIAFADSSVGHNGGIYRMAGWQKAGRTQPSHAYFDPTTFKLKHKASCRRIKDVDKTERELAQERGWIRIPLSHKYRYTLAL